MGCGEVRNTAAWEELEVWGWCTGTGVFEEELGVCVLECPLEYELGGQERTTSQQRRGQ